MRRTFRHRTTVLGLVVALLAGVVGIFLPTAVASAAPVSTTNACKYSVDPSIWREVSATLQGTASPATASADETVTLSGASISSGIPGSLVAFYNNVFMDPKPFPWGQTTSVPFKAWVAVSASNTVEGTKVFALDATASITIDAAGAATTDLAFTQDLPDSTWTATGNGPIEFRQAAAGTLGTIAGGAANGADVATTGSLYIKGAVGSIALQLDCQPGAQADNSGATMTPATAGAFATVSTGTVDPDPVATTKDCISGLGRYKQQEIVPIEATLQARTNPGTQGQGASVSFNPAVDLVIPEDYLLQLYRDSHNLLAPGENSFNLYVWAAVEATNTVEGIQTVGAETTYTVTVVDPTPADRNSGDETTGDLVQTVRMPGTAWTALGAGPVEFSEAPAGSMSNIGVVGKGYRDTGYQVNPYGSLFIRAETANYGSNLDCVAGDVSVNTGAGTPSFSNLGRNPAPNGSAGRYTITAVDLPAIATATVEGNVGDSGSKYQIVTTNVTGSPLRMTVAGQLVTLPTVKLDGTAKVTSGALKSATVVDPRGTNSGWNVVGQVTDLTGNAGVLAADNLGWVPTASVAHDPFPGDVATVTPGAGLADTTNPSTAGLGTARTLCSSAAGFSGGTFSCGGTLYLGVPASTAKGTYTGMLTLTLV